MWITSVLFLVQTFMYLRKSVKITRYYRKERSNNLFLFVSDNVYLFVEICCLAIYIFVYLNQNLKMLVLLFVALWFILRGDLLYVFPCVILFLCFSVLLVLRLPRLGKRELILVLFVRLFDLCLFGFVGFLFLLGSGKGCGLWLWHYLDFSLTFFL